MGSLTPRESPWRPQRHFLKSFLILGNPGQIVKQLINTFMEIKFGPSFGLVRDLYGGNKRYVSCL